MSAKPTDLAAVRKAFDSIKILKGQIISFGTCDADGNPNIAPIGSMRIVDDKTVHVLQGELGRTMKNLRSNPKAVFSVLGLPGLRSLLKDEDETLGYRVYCNYTGTEDSESALQEELSSILKRMPFLFRRSIAGMIRKRVKRVLRFEITDIRVVS